MSPLAEETKRLNKLVKGAATMEKPPEVLCHTQNPLELLWGTGYTKVNHQDSRSSAMTGVRGKGYLTQ